MTDPAFDAIIGDLRQFGLIPAGAEPEFVPLTGGVASDIWLVRAGGQQFAVKRALEKLRVAADWRAPVSRNAAEVAWLKTANAAVSGIAPLILAHQPERGWFAMNFLPPETHVVWKRELLEGRADAAFAAKVGTSLGIIHAHTASQGQMAPKFNDDALFRTIRLEPYFEYTATWHQNLAAALKHLVDVTLLTRLALVHGDVSPKNILVGPDGPVFLDAECAWYGDPAFDLAFCLNHLLLKCLRVPSAREGFLVSFDALAAAYFQKVDWELPAALEARAAALLPALLLARIDGKSPVEYVTDADVRQTVRDFAIPRIQTAVPQLSTVGAHWAKMLSTFQAQIS